MTLKELYEAVTHRGLHRDILYLELPERLPTEPSKYVVVNTEVLEKYGERDVLDIFPVFEQKKIYVSLKATNKEVADAYFDGFFRD